MYLRVAECTHSAPCRQDAPPRRAAALGPAKGRRRLGVPLPVPMVGFDAVQPFARADERAAAQEPELDSVVALCENRAYEVGLACLRLSDFSIELCSFCDDAAYSRTLSVLASHDPRQILFPPSSAQSVLARVAEAEFPAARCDQVPRRNWNEIKGLGYVRHYSHRSHVQALETDVKSKYLALSALAALVDAVEQSDGASFVKGTLRIKCALRPPSECPFECLSACHRIATLPTCPLHASEACECSSRRPLFHRYRSVEGVMLLDPATVANLELLRNLRTGDPKASLFGALNQVTLRIG